MLRNVAAAALLMSAVACSAPSDKAGAPISTIPSNLDEFELSSPAFEGEGPIPEEFTCNGAGISPPLEWSGVPQGSGELVLTLLDPDAPAGVFTHWTVYGISPNVAGFPQGAVPEGAAEGLNDFGEAGYGGPCPPEREPHRYIFTLAALAEPSGLETGAGPIEVDRVLRRAVATTTLTGQYPG